MLGVRSRRQMRECVQLCFALQRIGPPKKPTGSENVEAADE